MDKNILKDILESHKRWWLGCSDGKRADLRDADLRDADLRGADLRDADLRDADLRGADLRDADLRGADLRDADLRGADLCGADLCGADLRGADLRDADLRDAKNIDEVFWSMYTAFYPLQCPESGSYTAYKKARGRIVKLIIPADAKRSSATSRKCRASKAFVVSITDVTGNPCENQIRSDHDPDFIYTVGETVEINDFDENRWNECSTGIHHFITRDEAVKYN